jgi:MoxR-like ATPase
MLDVSLDAEPADTLQPIMTPETVSAVIDLCRQVLVSDGTKQAAVDLVLATQPGLPESSAEARKHLRYGASPRALQALIRAGRVQAVLAGRAHLDVADLAAVALPVLRHRVLLMLESELDGLDPETLIRELVSRWRTRH